MANNVMILTTADGIEIFHHPTESHSHRPDLDAEAVSRVSIDGRFFVCETVDFSRTIGFDHLVETTDADEIVLYKRGSRSYESRMVPGRKAEPTSQVTAIICKCGPEDGEEWDGKYVLITLFEGDPGRPEPFGKDDVPENRAFWARHALVPTDEEFADMKSKGLL